MLGAPAVVITRRAVPIGCGGVEGHALLLVRALTVILLAIVLLPERLLTIFLLPVG